MNGVVLALVIVLPTLLGLGFAGLGIWLAVRHLRRRDTDTQVEVRRGPAGDVVEVPVMQASRLFPGQSMAAVARNSGWATLRLCPDGIRYRLLRKKFIPYPAIAEVDVPYQGRPYLTMWVRGESTGLGFLLTAEPALHQTLWYLSRTCALSERAHALLRR